MCSCKKKKKLTGFHLNSKGIKYVLIPEGIRDFEWIDGLLRKKRLTYGYYKGER